uniref:Tumor necrosis factor alpha-induced protein 2 n=1 Tax=Neogobius melanostomus TaxID=47308 RepID=A0A8C6TJ49_9GOBI
MMESGLSEEEQDELHTELEKLWVQIRIQVHKIFSEDFCPDGLRVAVDCILDQEDLDRRWLDLPSDQAPVWRPSRTLQNHNELLQRMVRSRLRPQTKDQPKSPEETRLSSSVKQEVLRLGGVILGDLLLLSRSVVRSYPSHMDILNHFLKLYHNGFRLRLQELTDTSLDDSDRAYLLLWANHSYPQEVLLHPELRDRLKTQDLGPLLSPLVNERVQGQQLESTQGRVRRWLGKALEKEEDLWRSAGSELIDGFHFSPLALDVMQVTDGALKELKCLTPDQRPDQNGIMSEAQDFLSRYVRSLEEYLKENHSTSASVLKAQLVCEEQLRNFVQSQEMPAPQKQSCLDSLSALRDCGYCSLTSTIRTQLKPLLSRLWTPSWVSGTVPVLDQLLDFMSAELDQLQDLKPSCRQTVLTRLHQEVALRFVKNLLKSKKQSQEEQEGGASRMKADAHKLHTFFTDAHPQGAACDWTTQILGQISEVLRLQDQDLIQLELTSLIRTCPDLSAAHISRLLFLKGGQSAASIRRIKRGVEETRIPPAQTNQSPAFFSRIQVKWLHDKMARMDLTHRT